ncbi:unnamed protein product, partial [marine sediment metagenome]
ALVMTSSSRLESLESEMGKYTKSAKQAKLLFNHNRKAMGRLESVFNAYNKNIRFDKMVSAIAQNRPDNLWFTCIQTNPKLTRNKARQLVRKPELFVEGISNSGTDITDFVQRLKTSKLFKSTKLAYSRRNPKKTNQIEFKIVLGY